MPNDRHSVGSCKNPNLQTFAARGGSSPPLRERSVPPRSRRCSSARWRGRARPARAARSSAGARGERDTRTLIFMAERRSRVWRSASPSLRKVTIPHCSTPRSCTLTPGRFASSRRSSAPSASCFDRVDAQPHRVTGGDAQTDRAGDEALPVFEPARVVADDVSVGVGPRGGLEIDEGRLEPADGVAPHVQETRAAARADTCGPGPRACGSRSLAHRPRAGRPENPCSPRLAGRQSADAPPVPRPAMGVILSA
jgi:hypothetical protein